MARKKKTPLNDLDDALSVLNAARIAFHPEHFSIVIEDGDIFCEWVGPGDELPPEIEAAISLTCEAGRMTYGFVGPDAQLKVIEDHRGRWVLIPNVA